MEWLQGLNHAMRYVEENLTGEITLEGAARRAACSAYHFQRMFPYLTGIPFSEYVRRRRMTAAAMDLTAGKEKIVDLAAKYGYESPTAFNRAFQSVHGLPPTAAREKGAALKAFPPITFTLSIKGEEAMEYRIVEKEAFRVVGFQTKEPMTMEDCFEKVPLFWKQTSGDIPRLLPLMDDTEPMGVLGVSAYDGDRFTGYFIAVATKREAPKEMDEYQVPACTWAVFTCVGPVDPAVQALQKRVISEWLPSSGYEYAQAPDIEVYFLGDQSAPNYRSEVWLPVVKK